MKRQNEGYFFIRAILIIILFISLLTVHESAAYFDANTETQTDTLVGLMVNQKGKAMKNISVVYTGKVQRTDKKGIFMFSDVSLADTLTLLLPQKRIWQIPIVGMSFVKITVREDRYSIAEAKDEIVYISYGTMNKRTGTSGNTSISGDDLRKGGQTDIYRALTGKIAGLSVVQRDDGELKLVIRGGSPSFIIEDNSALLVVDGMIVDNLDHVDIHSVEQVTVMKDATIYGMRGANGAVVIKTK